MLYFPKHDKSKESTVNAFIVFFGWYAAGHIYLNIRYCELQFIVVFGANFEIKLYYESRYSNKKVLPAAPAGILCTQHAIDDNDDYSNNLHMYQDNAIAIAMAKEAERMLLHWTALATAA